MYVWANSYIHAEIKGLGKKEEEKRTALEEERKAIQAHLAIKLSIVANDVSITD